MWLVQKTQQDTTHPAFMKMAKTKGSFEFREMM
jgi:hypothetical protein